MQKILISFSVIVLFGSCNDTNKSSEPDPPTSVQEVKESVRGNSYKTVKAGIHSFISTDKEIQWLDPKPEEKFEKEMVDESKTLRLNFVNDTSVTVMYKNKTYYGTYTVDDATGESGTPGIKLRISYVDDEFQFGEGPPSKVTYTYVVEGISGKNLLLQTPRGINQRNIVVLMNKL